jgi:hypothetical protein
MFSSESTNAERLNDCRNVRREENKSVVPSRTGQALRRVPTPFQGARPAVFKERVCFHLSASLSRFCHVGESRTKSAETLLTRT